MNLDNLPLNLILRHENIKELQSYAEFFFAEKEERLEGLVDRISSDLKISNGFLRKFFGDNRHMACKTY